ncbi:AAA family ATPase (plasmid) [Falsihalocynthiibacter sp. SS001]|uniref:AAA family ATPase n=1 Tax=Falsihalocynthiibacter sp. SS001 TaxID=3349698 RepID=UPI0036D30B18
MQPQSYTHFAYPRLNGWFRPAFKSLIESANRKSGWGAFDDDASLDEALPKEYANDYCAVAALIRLCVTLRGKRDQIANQLQRPFSLTVIETRDIEWVEAVETALTDGLFPAVYETSPETTRPNVVCYKSSWRKATQTKIASDFHDALVRAAREAAPLVVVVPNADVLPDALCQKYTQIHALTPLSRNIMLMLFAMMQGRQSKGMMTKALREMPSDDALERISLCDMMLALRMSKLMAFVRHLNTLTVRSKANPQALDDVKGLGAARPQLMRLVNDIHAYSDGKLSWAEIPSNVLFDGPPGVGKTYAAQKLAEATGAHLVSTSFARWQANGHLGDFLAAMREDFEEAKRNAPSVLLIDEIDSFADRATNSSSNEDYNRAALNGLLEQLSGAEKTDGVLVVGTTNYQEKLDAALLRSGRFDQKIHIPLPDRGALTEILALHCGPSVNQTSLQCIATEMLGQSGADAAALVRQARSLARQDGGTLAYRHLKSALELFAKPLPAAMLHRIAIHEAGHVVVGWRVGAGLPAMAQVSSRGGQVVLDLERFEHEAGTLENRLAILLAGRAAELSCLGRVSSGAGYGEQSDLAQATLLAAQAETQFGLTDEHLIWRPVCFENLPELLRDHDLAARVQKRLDAAARLAGRIVDESSDLVDCLARALVERRQLNRSDLEQLMQSLSSASKSGKTLELERQPNVHGWLH